MFFIAFSSIVCYYLINYHRKLVGMGTNKENNSYYNQKMLWATLCLLFSVVSVVLSGVAGVLGFVGVFVLSKDLFLVVKIFFIVSLVLCLLAFIISIVIIFRYKKILKNNLYSKVKTRVIISLIISSYILLMFLILFIAMIAK